MSLPVPFSFRSHIERMLLFSGLNEPQARQAAFAGPGGFDLTKWPKTKDKAYGFERPAPPQRMTVHVVDVRGGFGVSRRRVEHWRKAAWDWHMPEDVPGWLPPLPGNALVRITDLANRLALWERFKELAYHQLGAGNGDSLALRPIESWSWHAGKIANRTSTGWALDCHHAEVLTDWLIETGRASLRALAWRQATYLKSHPAGMQGPILVAPHRAHAADRRVDVQGNVPVGVWTDIVKPVIESMPELEADYELKSGRGRPIPDVHDPKALYDWKGRRL